MATKGVSLSDEHKKKLSLAAQGRRWTDEQKAAMSVSRKGRKMSEAAKVAIGQARAGKPLSAEHRARIAAAGVGRKGTPSSKAKQRASFTPERRAAAAERAAKRNVEMVWTAEMRAKRAKHMAATVRKARKGVTTKLEELVATRLAGRRFEQQAKIPGAVYSWDFVLRDERLLIEADGCYWHGCARCGHAGKRTTLSCDKNKNAAASRLGWRLIRVPQCEASYFPLC